MDRQYLEFLSGEGSGTPLQYSRLENPMDGGAWKAAVHGVAKCQTWLTFTFHFPALEKEMATHSSVPAWRIPGMVEPGGLPSMESRRVEHDWSDLAAAAAATEFLSLESEKGEWQRPWFSPLFPSFSLSLVLLSFSSFLSSWTWIKESLFKV